MLEFCITLTSEAGRQATGRHRQEVHPSKRAPQHGTLAGGLRMARCQSQDANMATAVHLLMQ